MLTNIVVLSQPKEALIRTYFIPGMTVTFPNASPSTGGDPPDTISLNWYVPSSRLDKDSVWAWLFSIVPDNEKEFVNNKFIVSNFNEIDVLLVNLDFYSQKTQENKYCCQIPLCKQWKIGKTLYLKEIKKKTGEIPFAGPSTSFHS